MILKLTLKIQIFRFFRQPFSQPRNQILIILTVLRISVEQVVGPISAAKRLDNTIPKKRRSSGGPLATSCTIRPAQELTPRPPARTAMCSTTVPTGETDTNYNHLVAEQNRVDFDKVINFSCFATRESRCSEANNEFRIHILCHHSLRTTESMLLILTLLFYGTLAFSYFQVQVFQSTFPNHHFHPFRPRN